MTDIDPTQMKQHASAQAKPETTGLTQAGNALGTSAKDDLTGLDEIDIQQDASEVSAPRRRKVAKPDMTIEEAIDEGKSLPDIEALQEAWNAYNRQETFRKAAEEKKALADRIATGRRKYADELLALADEHGVSMKDAKGLFLKALEADKKSKARTK